LLAEEDRRIDQEAQTAAKRVEETERLAVAKRSAEIEVKARVQAHSLPAPVVEFLAQEWLKVLLLLHLNEGTDTQTWKGALATMDQLIGSIEPKSPGEKRRGLVAVIPGLIKKLAIGLKVAGIEHSVRTKFFGELIQLHKQAITGPGEQEPAEGQTDA